MRATIPPACLGATGQGTPAGLVMRDAWVAEVKSTTPQNEERQLRLGLGQVTRYRQLLAEDGLPVRALIATEREPSDPSWAALCEEQGIVLGWPGAWRA